MRSGARDLISEFRDFAAQNGYELPAHIEPGRLIRFSTNGRRGDSAGWARLFDDCEGGIVGDWRTGHEHVWQAKRDRQFTPEEQRGWLAKMEQQKREAKAQRQREENEAAQRARAIWNEAKAPSSDHGYLLLKKIPLLGFKVYQGELVINGMNCDGALIMPFRNSAGEIRSLEFIGADGEKRFLPGASYKAAYFALGTPGPILAICEGAATALSIHNATQYPVRAAGTSGNLLAVAEAMRDKLPDARLILCADNDSATDGNPGLTKATEAARAVGGYIAVPPVSGDFNDLASAEGHAAVKAAIAAAIPALATPTPAAITKSNSGDPGLTELVTRCFADIAPVPVHWLWPERIARGKLTVIAGDPGLGKSMVTASLAAIVTRGGRWPVDRTPCEKGRVIFLSAEDDPADTIRPRLDAAGADVSLCEVIQFLRVPASDGSGSTTRRAFSLKTDMRHLSELLARLGDVALVIIDPVTAYMGDADTHRNSDVRAVLAEVSEVAGQHKAAFIAISHLNKGESAKALQRVTGSLAFVAAARAAFLVAEDKAADGQRLFVPMKNNIGPDSTGYAYRIEEAVIQPSGIKTCRISWSSETVAITADEALTPEGETSGKSELEAAKQFLRAELSEGPVSAKTVEKDAQGNGIAIRTLHRAKAALGVVSVKGGGMAAGWQWQLSKIAKTGEDRQDSDVAAFEEIGNLRQPAEPEAERF